MKSGEACRIKLALISNIGGAPLTPKDRAYIASKLYGDHHWTMQRIGQALSVDKATISRDLRPNFNCCTVQQLKPTKTASNPKRANGEPSLDHAASS